MRASRDAWPLCPARPRDVGWFRSRGQPRFGARRSSRFAALALASLWVALSAPAHVRAQAAGESSPQRVAVTDLRVDGDAVPASRAQTLTEMVRTTALALPASRYQVITRENIIALLPPDMSWEECTEAACEIEFGRMVGVDFVVTGEIARFGEVLQIQLRLYRVSDGTLLSGVSGRARSEEEVPDAVEEVTLRLLEPLGVEPRGGVARDRRVVQPRIGGGSARGVGVLEVFVAGPANALVEVDGVEAGVGGRQLNLDVGRRRVVVSAPGYASFEGDVLIQEGEVETLRVPALAMLPVSLWLSADVHGAEVLVDNRRVGLTSRLAPVRLEIAATATSLRVVREGYTAAEAALRLQPGGTSSWHVAERQAGGSRTLALVPRSLQEVASWGGEGADVGFVEVLVPGDVVGEVWLEGRLLGVTGGQLPIAPGTHLLSVQVPGHHPEEVSVALSAGQARRHTLRTIRPLPAVVYLSCNVAGADVVVDGRVVGRTPVGGGEVPYELPASSLRMEVRREGQGEWVEALRLVPGGELRVTCDLRHAAPAPAQQTPPAGTPPGSPQADFLVPPGSQWSGTYSCAQGATDASLSVQRATRNSASAVFSFSTPRGVSGAYWVHATVNARTRQVVWRTGEWVNQPAGFVTVGFSGTVSADGQRMSGTVSHASCGSFSFVRSPTSAATPVGSPAADSGSGVTAAAAPAPPGDQPWILGGRADVGAGLGWVPPVAMLGIHAGAALTIGPRRAGVRHEFGIQFMTGGSPNAGCPEGVDCAADPDQTTGYLEYFEVFYGALYGLHMGRWLMTGGLGRSTRTTRESVDDSETTGTATVVVAGGHVFFGLDGSQRFGMGLQAFLPVSQFGSGVHQAPAMLLFGTWGVAGH